MRRKRKKYTFISIIDDKAVFHDGDNYFIDVILTETAAVPGIFTESSEAMFPVKDQNLLETAKKIKSANERLEKFAIISYSNQSRLATVVGKSDGTADGEERCQCKFQVENFDFDIISDDDFDLKRGGSNAKL